MMSENLRVDPVTPIKLGAISEEFRWENGGYVDGALIAGQHFGGTA